MTETLTEQPTTEALLSRCTELDFPEPAIATPSTGMSDRGDRAARPVYITTTNTLDGGREDYVGTVKALVPAPSGNGWLDREDPIENTGRGFDRYNGAMVNPAPANGKYYRTISDISVLVRYNDDDHTGDRGQPNHPWTLLRRNGENVWPIADDGMESLHSFAYIEVDFTETAVRTAETEEAEAAPEPVAEGPARWEDGERTATRGMAAKEADGTVVLDPPLVRGETYLFWRHENFDEAISDSYLQVYVGTDPEHGASYRSIGTVDWRASTEAVRFAPGAYNTSMAATSDYHWVRVAMARPEPRTDTATTIGTAAYFRSLILSEQSSFEEFNEKVNEVAQDAGWCGEYDRIVKGVGMKGRNSSWDIEVEVEFTFEDSSPTSGFDEEAASYHDLNGLVINNAEYRATATVTVRVEDQPNASDADEALDSSIIESYLRGQMEHARNIDVTDWTVQSTEEAE